LYVTYTKTRLCTADFTFLELNFRYKAQRAKVSKNVSVSAYQRLGLGLVSDPKLNVSVSVSIS